MLLFFSTTKNNMIAFSFLFLFLLGTQRGRSSAREIRLAEYATHTPSHGEIRHFFLVRPRLR